MPGIAAEVGYSETAFLFPRSGRTFGVRYFSPKMEVSFCGHATVAAAVALAERICQGELVFETSAGTVPVRVTETGGWLRATLTSVEPHVEDVTGSDVAEALKLPVRWLEWAGWVVLMLVGAAGRSC
jgi:PhzF family phenazine biosynthesis protein